MKLSDISETEILNIFADYQGSWGFWNGRFINFPINKNGDRLEIKDWEMARLVSDDVPEKMVLLKLKKLVNRKLLGGCACGCRGDFEITDKGLKLIGIERTRKYTGY